MTAETDIKPTTFYQAVNAGFVRITRIYEYVLWHNNGCQVTTFCLFQSLVDFTTTTPLQDECVTHVPIEIVSELLVEVSLWCDLISLWRSLRCFQMGLRAYLHDCMRRLYFFENVEWRYYSHPELRNIIGTRTNILFRALDQRDSSFPPPFILLQEIFKKEWKYALQLEVLPLGWWCSTVTDTKLSL
jgi:hypothetical protein